MADTFEKELITTWGQHIKPDSKEVLPVFGCEDKIPNSDGWQVVDTIKILGHLFADSGSILSDIDLVICKMKKAFWGNSGKLIKPRLPLY